MRSAAYDIATLSASQSGALVTFLTSEYDQNYFHRDLAMQGANMLPKPVATSKHRQARCTN